MTTEETTESKPRDPMYGKAWTVSSRHASFTDADQAREKLVTETTLARATTLTTTPRKAKVKEKSATKPEKKKRIGKQRQR